MIKLETTTAYTVKEASELLHLNEQTLRRYIKTGKIRAQKVGVPYYVTEDTIREFLNGEVRQSDN